jgi:putrescine aminotransferase
MGELFEKGFKKLQNQFPQILADYRRKGLMMGLEYSHESHGPRMSAELSKNGVIAVFSGNDPKVMRIMPSLVIQPNDVDFILNALEQSMTAISNGGAHG